MEEVGRSRQYKERKGVAWSAKQDSRVLKEENKAKVRGKGLKGK